MSVAMVGLALFGGCAGGLFNFELTIFGTDDSFGVGVSHLSKKFGHGLWQFENVILGWQ